MNHRSLNRSFKRSSNVARLIAGAGAVVLVAACASQGDIPTSSLAVARTSLSQAEADNAPRLAPIEYQNSRAKLVRAEEAVKAKRYTEARALADESAADADVAQRKARAITAANTASDAQRSNAVLNAEINRTTTTTQTVVTPVPGVAPATQTTTIITTKP